jgi:Putative lumazine-binding
MRALLVIASALLLAPAAASAQTPDHDAAYAVVTKLFDGMRTRDTASMRAAFIPTALLQSVSTSGVRSDEIAVWINSVANAPAGVVLDERLGTPTVQVNGDLASVWVDYWFFAGERFSHCGVDAFVLARQAGAWKILSVADTRQREGCRPAPAR